MQQHSASSIQTKPGESYCVLCAFYTHAIWSTIDYCTPCLCSLSPALTKIEMTQNHPLQIILGALPWISLTKLAWEIAIHHSTTASWPEHPPQVGNSRSSNHTAQSPPNSCCMLSRDYHKPLQTGTGYTMSPMQSFTWECRGLSAAAET